MRDWRPRQDECRVSETWQAAFGVGSCPPRMSESRVTRSSFSVWSAASSFGGHDPEVRHGARRLQGEHRGREALCAAPYSEETRKNCDARTRASSRTPSVYTPHHSYQIPTAFHFSCTNPHAHSACLAALRRAGQPMLDASDAVVRWLWEIALTVISRRNPASGSPVSVPRV
ncbi:hypothetical protein MTO96_020957 [Rhipicephalus appendiculatus]